MPDREYLVQRGRELPSHAIENPVGDNPLPDLEAMLRDAAAAARRRAFVPSYELVEGMARGRRTARYAVHGLFGVVLVLLLGAAAVAGVGRGDSDRNPIRQPPAASAVPLDPSLRQYQTRIPILTWTPDAGADMSAVRDTDEFRTAVFSGLKPGNHDYGSIDDLRKVFPDAPVGGPAVAIDQSTTKAELERAATNLRKLHGVQDARVVEVTGLWFTVSATGPAKVTEGKPEEPPSLNPTELNIKGTSGRQGRDATGKWFNWVSATYLGPPIARATFDLFRQRAAEAVRIDISEVVVAAESAAPKPDPKKS